MRLTKLAVMAAILLAASTALAKNDEPVVRATADRASILIGDNINYTVHVKAKKGVEVKFPDFKDNLIGSFEIRDLDSQVKTGFFGNRAFTNIYSITSYSTGAGVIPPIEIKYKPKNARDWSTARTNDIKIVVGSLLPKGKAAGDIKDIKGPIYFWEINWALILILVILGALTALLFSLYKKWKNGSQFKLPHETALEELEAAKVDLARSGDIKKYFIGVSDTIRNYIERAFELNAPEMTTEEFLNNLKDSKELSIDNKRLLREFLSSCDLVKFAKYLPGTEEIEAVYISAKNFIEETNAALNAEENKE